MTDLPPSWARATLGDLLIRIEAGKSFTCEPRPAEPDEWGVIKVSAMTWGAFREDENKAVPAHREIDPANEIKPGDILVSRANTAEYVGAPVLVGECRPQLLLSDKSLRLVPSSEVDRRWLLNVLASPDVRRAISARATGTKESMRNISQQALSEIEVLVPPQAEQHRIVSSLESYLERLDSAAAILGATPDSERAFKGVLAQTVELRHALLREAFRGRLTVQDPGDSPATDLLEKIRIQREAEASKQSRRATRVSPANKRRASFQQEGLAL
ncbi:hypothetical protein AB0C10_32475 [Microbispora amethystogenes]|uniref:restriction endonuclease subunit S n=1 Tax=Microbispora amethystogenes TaxID=1427754 RepID=UPI0033D33791